MIEQRHRIRRLTAVCTFAVVTLAAPALPLVVALPSVHEIAGCPGGRGGVLVGMQVLGAYTDNCDLVVQPPPAMGAAPSAGAIIACRDLPGCLPMFVNNPGWVRVPHVDTRVRSSR